MIDIKWSVICLLNGMEHKYSVFAPSEFIAKAIVKEMIVFDLNKYEGYDLVASPYEVTKDDLVKVIKARESIFTALSEDFTNLTYTEFVSKLNNFDAFDIELVDDRIFSYKIDFMGLVLTITFKNSTSILDTSSIVYNSSSGSKILILNNWSEFYYIA